MAGPHAVHRRQGRHAHALCIARHHKESRLALRQARSNHERVRPIACNHQGLVALDDPAAPLGSGLRGKTLIAPGLSALLHSGHQTQSATRDRCQPALLLIGRATRRDQRARLHQHRTDRIIDRPSTQSPGQRTDLGQPLAQTIAGLGQTDAQPAKSGHLRPAGVRISAASRFLDPAPGAVFEHLQLGCRGLIHV